MKAISLLKNKRICWYPSAGPDFRDLLMIDEKFLVNGKKIESYPDIYVHCSASFDNDDIKEIFENPKQAKGKILYKDDKTNISVISVRKLERENIGLNEGYTNDNINPELLNRPLYFKIKIESNRLGVYEKDLIYFVSENGTFAINYLLKHKLNVSHIVRVRYGNSFGGARYNGNFILHIMNQLKTRYFICSPFNLEDEYDATNELLKIKGLYEKTPKMNLFARTINQGWSEPDVDWWEIELKKPSYYLLTINGRNTHEYSPFDAARIIFKDQIAMHFADNRDYYSDFVPNKIACLLYNLEQDRKINDEELVIRDRLFLLMNSFGFSSMHSSNQISDKTISKNYRYYDGETLIDIRKKPDNISIILKSGRGCTLKTNAFIMNDYSIYYYFKSVQTNNISDNISKLGRKIKFEITLEPIYEI